MGGGVRHNHDKPPISTMVEINNQNGFKRNLGKQITNKIKDMVVGKETRIGRGV